MQIATRPMFDDITLCKHVTAEENTLMVLNSFSYKYEKLVILATKIVFPQIAILITSLPSGTGLYVMRWVKYGGW